MGIFNLFLQKIKGFFSHNLGIHVSCSEGWVCIFSNRNIIEADDTNAFWHFNVVFFKGVKYCFEMDEIRVQIRTIYKNIIKENKDKVSQVRFEDRVHEALESGWGISESKRHDSELIESKVCFESCFVYISMVHSYLMITSSQVDFGKEFCPI